MSAEYTLEPDKWVERYADALYSFALARINKREVVEDLVQDTFLSGWKARDTFQHNASEKTWLISILKRKIIDHYRKKSTQNELNTLDADKTGDSSNDFFDANGKYEGHWADGAAPQEWKNNPETQVETDEFNAVLNGCIGKLPEKAAAVFTLKNIDGLESKEICKELDITPSNYWILMHRAKLELRKCMEKNWGTK